MKPNEPGIWEWFDNRGIKRLVEVVDVSCQVEDQWLRVYWWGGYYNIENEPMECGVVLKAEWPDRWGNRVGYNGSLSEDQLYRRPTIEKINS